MISTGCNFKAFAFKSFKFLQDRARAHRAYENAETDARLYSAEFVLFVGSEQPAHSP